ncbi:uncharacterized protein LOC141858456 [Brevipalpus obovatus]|uniref:uncharacterized protein LOC141858456 n=1 Tax=Brevipalpus obovatus TaxID=246614 RepID=UPI003D9E304A
MSTHFTEDPRIARQRTEEEEDDDPVTKAIKKTGCLQLHYDLQECMYEHRDWRICKPQVQTFRDCMEEYNKNKKN